MENTGEMGNPVQENTLDINNPPAILAEIRSKVIGRAEDIKRYSGAAAAQEDRWRTMFNLRPNYEPEREAAAPEPIVEMMEQSADLRSGLKERGVSYQDEVTMEDRTSVPSNFYEATLDNGMTHIEALWVEARDELVLGETFDNGSTDITIVLGKPQEMQGYQRKHFPYDIEIVFADEGSRSGVYKSNGQSYSINEQDLSLVTDALTRAKTISGTPNKQK